MSLFQFGFTRCSTTTSSSCDQSVPNYLPQQDESGLNNEEYRNVSTAVTTLASPAGATSRSKRGKYTVYTDEAHARIGHYAGINGNERARKHFLSEYPNLTESTVRNFKKMYLMKMREEKKKNPAAPQPVTTLSVKPKGRPPIMLDLDDKLIKYLHALRAKGGVVNIHVIRATAEALICSNPSQMHHFNKFDMPRSWVQSIYRRMGVTRRLGTTGRPPVPKGMYTEFRLEFLKDIDHKVRAYSIPKSLIINIDQTPSSYVSVGKQTMASKGSKSVAITGLTDKRNITLTFSITFSGKFLPLQVIYAGKTKASHPRGYSFPTDFCISHNTKHWSNEEETLNLIEKIIKPYIAQEKKILVCHLSRKHLLYGMYSRAK